MRKETESGLTQAPGSRIAAFPIEEERLVEVDEGRPNKVSLANEEFAGVAEKFQRMKSLATMAGGDGEIRESLASLVAHAELLEPVKGLLGKPGALFAQVELQVHFRPVEVAQSH